MTNTASVEPQTQTLDTVTPTEARAKPEANTAVKVMAIVTPLLSFMVQYWIMFMAIALGSRIHSIDVVMLAGGLIGVFVMPLIVMLLFQIGKRFRNSRSRWTIFLNTGLVFLVLSILSSIVKMLV